MQFTFTITILRNDGTIYTCKRIANTEEQAVNMVKLPAGEEIICIEKDWTK